MMQWLNSFIALSIEAAPWLVLGMLVAGLIKAWVPMHWVKRHLGGSGVKPILKAAVLGAPLPLCSCSVIPVTLEVRRSGASPAATVSFLVATPETGADSIGISYALLGPFMAVMRPLAALSSAVVAGLMTQLIAREIKTPIAAHAAAPVTSCCAASHGASSASEVKSSCASAAPIPMIDSPFRRSLQGIRYGFTDVWNDMVLWLVLGLVFASAVDAFVPQHVLQEWGSGPMAMLAMMLIGVPMYICATASTPIAAGLLLAGISPGTVLVFLLAGPATNMATLGLVRKEMGNRVLLAYLSGLGVTALGFGLLTDFLVQQWQLDLNAAASTGADMLPPLLAHGATALLLLLTVRLLWQKWNRRGKGSSAGEEVVGHSHPHPHSR